MEKITPPSSTIIPTVDLSPFTHGGDESSKQKVRETISEACTNLGVFYIENHGVSLDKCKNLLKMTHQFFKSPHKLKANSGIPEIPEELKSGAGYGSLHDQYHDFEYLLMYLPGARDNGVPTSIPDYKETYEEVYNSLVNTSRILEEIINDCLDLPRDFLKIYNNDRRWDFMMPLYYTKAGTTNTGVHKHEDPQFITIIIQENVSGLQVFKDEWIPAIPPSVQFTVVVGDLVQVLSNKKYKNVTHQALKNSISTRLAIDFAYGFGYDKWIEPLRLLPEQIGVKPKYKGFEYREYIDLIKENIFNPPEREEDFINITYYEI